LEHAPRHPDDAAVLANLDPELHGLLLGVPIDVPLLRASGAAQHPPAAPFIPAHPCSASQPVI
jgi:hypothetical protein